MKKLYFLSALLVGILALACPSYAQVRPTNPGDKDQASTNIVGGATVSISNVPWQVLLEANGATCGGAIIAPNWIITAAHCVTNRTPSQLKVYAGISLRSQKTTGQVRNVTQIIIHGGYGTNANSSNDNDIALLRLSTPLTFNTNVQGIRYATDRDAAVGLTNPGVVARISGWGSLYYNGPLSDQLRAATVPIQPNAAAAGQYDPLPSPPSDITANMLAAGSTNGGIDACQGDSGGPLVVFENGVAVLAGITSFGRECANPNFFGIYTRVSRYCDWIADRIAIVEGPTTVCTFNSTFNLRNGPATGATVTWTATPTSRFTPSSGTGTAATFRATSNSPGTRTITFTVTSGCGTTTIARNITTNISTAYTTQTTYNGPYATIYVGVLQVPGATSYEWYLNGQFQQVSSYNHTFTVDRCGDYSIGVRARTNACGWTAISTAYFSVICSGNFAVYPNPADDYLTVELTDSISAPLVTSNNQTAYTQTTSMKSLYAGQTSSEVQPSFQIELYDRNQKVIVCAESINGKVALDTKPLPKGNFLLRIYYKDAITTKQVLIK